MIRQDCKAKIPDNALFCPNCGPRLEKQNQPSGTAPIIKSNIVRTLLDSTKSVSNSMLNSAEGIFSSVPAVMIVCAPVIEVNYYSGSNNISMITLVTTLARFSDYLGKCAITVRYFSRVSKTGRPVLMCGLGACRSVAAGLRIRSLSRAQTRSPPAACAPRSPRYRVWHRVCPSRETLNA